MFKVSDVPSLSSLVPQLPLHLPCSLELVYLTLSGVTPLTPPFLFPLPLNLGLGWRIFHFPPSCCLEINLYYYSRERQRSLVHEDFFPGFQAVLPLKYETRASLDNACGKTILALYFSLSCLVFQKCIQQLVGQWMKLMVFFTYYLNPSHFEYT